MVLIPLRDENPSSITPLVNWGIVASCIAVFLWQMYSGENQYASIIYKYGFIPENLLDPSFSYTLITSMFLHGGLLHLGGNMLYLYIFGDNVEDMCGHTSYLAFYLVCGVLASFAFYLSDPASNVPAIGASGAISGVLGAYVLLFPRARILTAVPIGPFIRVIHIPAFIMIGFWFVYQFLLAFLALETGVAYWAHIGGFVAGLALGKIFARKRRAHPLYTR